MVFRASLPRKCAVRRKSPGTRFSAVQNPLDPLRLGYALQLWRSERARPGAKKHVDTAIIEPGVFVTRMVRESVGGKATWRIPRWARKMEVRANHVSDRPEEHAIGEAQATLLALDFNRSVRIEARAEPCNSDAVALFLRAPLDR